MPYIQQEDRHCYHAEYTTDNGLLTELGSLLAQCDDKLLAGELNYVITWLVGFIVDQKGEQYHRYNAIIGALECCKQELYRRHIGPYEDKAIERNGAV